MSQTPDTPLIPYGPDQWEIGDSPPTLDVYGERVPLVKRETIRRLKYTKLQVVVCSNVRYHPEMPARNQQVALSIRRSTDWLFREQWKRNPQFLDIYNVWDGKRGRTRRVEGEFSFPAMSDIHSIKWIEPRIEYGQKPRGQRIHYQGVLEIYHWSQLRLNQKRCQEYLNYMTTYSRDQNVQPRPDQETKNIYIKGIYVHAVSLDNRTSEIYNMKSLINPYIRYLKRNGGREEPPPRRLPGDEETQSP